MFVIVARLFLFSSVFVVRQRRCKFFLFFCFFHFSFNGDSGNRQPNKRRGVMHLIASPEKNKTKNVNWRFLGQAVSRSQILHVSGEQSLGLETGRQTGTVKGFYFVHDTFTLYIYHNGPVMNQPPSVHVWPLRNLWNRLLVIICATRSAITWHVLWA